MFPTKLAASLPFASTTQVSAMPSRRQGASRSLLTSAALALLALPLCAQDRVAGYARMFNSTTTSPSAAPVRLNGITPPLLGGQLSLGVTAPTYTFGVLALSPLAQSGLTVPSFGGTIDFYLQPSGLSVLPLPLTGGIGGLQLPLPPVPALSGLDLAWQAVVMSPSGAAGSNLLLANLGSQPGGGAMQFAITFQKGIPPGSYLNDGAGNKQSIYCNDTGNETLVTITGTKTANAGALEIRDGAGRPLATVQASSDIISVTVRVNPGNCIYFYNDDKTNALTATWEISVAVK